MRAADIDFGFMLGISPGGVGFEAAPFKLTQDYIDIIGGTESPKWAEFKLLVQHGFRDVRKHAERIIMMIELMQRGAWQPQAACRPPADFQPAHTRLEAAVLLARRAHRVEPARPVPARPQLVAKRRLRRPPRRVVGQLGVHAPLRPIPVRVPCAHLAASRADPSARYHAQGVL